jgi:hypothetical protein
MSEPINPQHPSQTRTSAQEPAPVGAGVGCRKKNPEPGGDPRLVTLLTHSHRHADDIKQSNVDCSNNPVAEQALIRYTVQS